MSFLLKNIWEGVKSYLTFNYAERRGIMVLVLLILLVEGGGLILPAMITPEKPDLSDFEEELEVFSLSLSAPDTLAEKKKEWRTTNSYKKPYPKRPTYAKKASAGKPPMMIEINTADSLQLTRLYGIGPSFAGRILKYRGMLGGFFSPEQLLEVYGMDSLRYEGFKEHIRVDTSFIRKIPVNTAEFRDLLRHPYLDYETVKLIVNHRDRVGPICCEDSLRSVIAFDPMWEVFRYYAEY